jgi:benzil reductase ((S)-benzoin forming)
LSAIENLYLITGTTKGLGAALCDVLADKEANAVFSISRFAAVDQSPSNIFADFSRPESIEPAFEKFVDAIAGQTFARAVLINNAGVVAPVGPFSEINAATLKTNLEVNLLAPMILMRLFANATRAIANERLIINISSGAAKRAVPGWAAYCTAKAGLEMSTRAAALEATSTNLDASLQICSLAPGVVDTPMQGQIREKSAHEFPDVERFRAMKNDGALRDAHEVARDIVMLIQQGRLTNGGNFDIRELLST